MFREVITMMAVIEVPTKRFLFDPNEKGRNGTKTTHQYIDPLVKERNKLIIASSGTNMIKISNVMGEPLCKLNLDQPLPYSWKLVVDGGSKVTRDYPKVSRDRRSF